MAHRKRLLSVAVLVTAISGCAGSGASDTSDALYPVGNTHRLCVNSVWRGLHRDAFTEGLDTFSNRGPVPVEVTSVEWPTTGNVEADSIRVFQRRRNDQFATLGLVSGLPQHLTGNAGRAWDRAQPAQTAILGPADDDRRYLVFAIGVTGTNGTGGPLKVHYTDGQGHRGTATSLVRFSVAPRCKDATTQ